jgi:fructokinase
MVPTATLRAGIDIGGTKIQGVVVDDVGEIVAAERIPCPQMDYGETIRAVARLLRLLESEVSAELRVGVGCPGSASKDTGLHRNSNATWLIGNDVISDLTRELQKPIAIQNDANCFALSEALGGSGAGSDIVLGIVLGTGVGSGLVVSGRIMEGRNAICGEFGHCALPWPRDDERPGPECYCGRSGCIETFLSGPALANDFVKAGGPACNTLEIERLASRGDSLAKECVDRFCDRLARSVGLLINILDPDVIVLGGGISTLSSIHEALPRLTPKWVFSDAINTLILPAKYGQLSGARGAALLLPSG